MRTNVIRILAAACVLLCVGFASCHRGPHSVTLSWHEPPVTPGISVVAYNVYRSTTSGGPFVKLASRVPEPHYEDYLVVNGRTYFYVVTALDQAGHESRFSAEAKAIIP
jgi:fibronectin type 3 domain-containing protein